MPSQVNSFQDILTDFNVQGRKHYKEEPETCPMCGDKGIGQIEFIGVQETPLFWECKKCDSRFLKYSYSKTRAIFKRIECLFFDLDNLDDIYLEPPN